MNPRAKLAQPLFAGLQKLPTRDGFGEGLVLLGEKSKDVVVLSADLKESTRSHLFEQKFPNRFFEVGVSEQNMVTVAAGLALTGKIPFVSSYAVFCPGRCWEQIRTTICYNDANVKIAGAHAGVSVGPDGATHQALEDVALMRSLPNMTVIVPCDFFESRKATVAAAKISGPVYLRFAREKSPVFTSEESPFVVGKAEIFSDGSDVAIIACGPLVYECLVAAVELKKVGISARVINNHTIKPLDSRAIVAAARECGAIVTVEEHQIIGGLGSAVAELVSNEFPVPIVRVGVRDRFGESGSPDELLRLHGLTAKNIVASVKEVVSRKSSSFSDASGALEEIHGVRKLLSPVAQEHFFKVHSGEIVRNLPELQRAVQRMDDATFHHHVNHARNDFSAWVRDVHKSAGIARAIASCKSRNELVNKLSVILQDLEQRKR